MTNNEFISKLLGYNVIIDCSAIDIECEMEGHCNPATCTLDNIGLQELDIHRLVEVLTSPELADVNKLFLNTLYGKCVYKDTDNLKVFMNLPQDDWHEIPMSLIKCDHCTSIAEILGDALTHHIDFKVENGKLYVKDCEDVPN